MILSIPNDADTSVDSTNAFCVFFDPSGAVLTRYTSLTPAGISALNLKAVVADAAPLASVVPPFAGSPCGYYGSNSASYFGLLVPAITV